MDIFSGREVNIILSTTVRYRGSFLVFPLGRCTKSTCAFVNHPFIKLISYYHMNRPSASCKIFKNILLFIWLHWVFVAELGATLKLWCAAFSSTVGGFSCYGSQALDSRALVIAACGFSSCSIACGIFTDQGSNRCPLHCKAYSFF